MFVELLEFLRCPRQHEETALIASAIRSESRHIVDGMLGCPTCGAEFRIADGIARFDESTVPPATEPPSAEIGMRIAAFLELTDARGFAVLCGRWGAHADQVQRLSTTPLVLVNPPPLIADVAAVLRCGGVVPLAAACARAAALDVDMPSRLVESVVRAVRTGGRILGPASLSVPDGITEFVRDDRVWVGEKLARDTASPLVSIRREQS